MYFLEEALPSLFTRLPRRIILGYSEGMKRAGALLETPAQKLLLNTAIDLGFIAGVAYAIVIAVLLVGVSNVRAVIIHVLDAVAITVRAPTPGA